MATQRPGKAESEAAIKIKEALDNGYPIMCYDGVCNLCNGTVRFVFPRDETGLIRYAHIQTPEILELLKSHGISEDDALKSITFIENGVPVRRSTAALRISTYMSLPWKLLYACTVVPTCVRDAVYDFVGSNRYKWFGQTDACARPEKGLKERFLA